MFYYVYLLISIKKLKSKSYVGYTNNLKNRIKLHNSGKGAKSTKGRSWEIVYSKRFKSKVEAMKEEYSLKKNRKKRKILITKYLSTNQV